MSDDIVQDAKAEISGMAKQGVRHPSTKPVLGGLAAGAVAGALLPGLSLIAGAVIGGGLMFYKRLRP
ncbi:MAG: hypothetical protein WBL74_08135 [Novosphingobium sp.]|uniref:hypothetical protein n=1 Tax=Novosphingobium sp. TaxID=1874826 RepID=UPI003C7A66DA